MKVNYRKSVPEENLSVKLRKTSRKNATIYLSGIFINTKPINCLWKPKGIFMKSLYPNDFIKSDNDYD